MLARASVALELGESVILDASWRHETWRALARRVAVDTASDLVEIKCEAPSGIAADRIAADRQGDRGLSDATAATLVAMGKDFDYWPEAVAVNTVGKVTESLSAAVEALRGSLSGDAGG